MTSVRHELAFRPRARLVSVLGEHLISDQAVGLVELVKNAYDADATEVSIEIDGLADPETTTVTLTDNGCGMQLADISEKWLSPAVDHKERQKQRGERTLLGRLPIGEKGVGRFAVHQIGRELRMVTRAKGSPELLVEVDWNRFDDGEQFLDGMAVSVVERDPELFPDDRSGTQLIMRRARAPWSDKLLAKVHRALRRLQSPLPDDRLRFRVRLRCPEHPEYEGIDPTDILEKAHYEFRALVTAEGQCDFEYVCRHPAVQGRTKSGTENLVPIAASELQGHVPQSGSFYLNLYVWDRSRNYLLTSGVSARELDAQCGVSLFRDGLRVLPYGDPGDDWLLLDQERIQAPAERIGNNQVIGLVLVDQSSNLLLRDKTNREGLIENSAFLDLKALTRAAIRIFLLLWKKDRPRETPKPEAPQGTVESAIAVAEAIRETARDDVQVRIPGAAAPTSVTENVEPTDEGPVAKSDASADEAMSDQSPAPEVRIVSQRQAVDLLIEDLSGARRSISDREYQLDVLLHLAATGLAAERVVHEFGRQVAAAFEALARLRTALGQEGRIGDGLAAMEACLGTLRNEFRVLAPYEAIERAQRAREIEVREAAELALTLNRAPLAAAHIQGDVTGEGFQVRARVASLVQILDNLVNNACYWVATLPEGAERRVGFLLDPLGSRILVADSGPGVHADAVGQLFQPFSSLKAGGKGLGLHISAELMKALGGQLTLADERQRAGLPDWATGAVFVLDFLRSPSGTPQMAHEKPGG